MVTNTSKKKSFVAGAAILGIAGLIVKIIGAFYRIPLANIIGTDGMAYYEVAYPYYSWLLVISSAGLPTAISKLVSERIAIGDAIGAKRVFRAANRILLLIGVITTALLFVLSESIANLSNAPLAKYSLMALAPALFFVSIMCVYRGFLQGMQCMSGTAITQIIEQVAKLAVGFSLAAYFIKSYPDKPELAAMGALIGVSVSELLALIIIVFYYNRSIKNGTLGLTELERTQTITHGPSMKTIYKRLILIAIPITLGASIMPVTGIADSVLIINILQSKNELLGMLSADAASEARAAYTVLRSYVTPLINMPAVLTLALSMSLVPAISEASTKHDKKTVQNASRTGIKLAMFIGAPCTVGLFVVGGPLMEMLYTALRNNSGYSELAAGVMWVAAIGVLFLSLVQTLTGILQGLGKPHVPVIFLAIGGAVKVISMIILMKYTNLGIIGAAISTVLCYSIAGIGDTIYTIRTSRLKISVIDTFVKPIVASVIMGVAVWASYTFLANAGHPNFATVASVGVGVAVYCIIMIVFRPFNANDFDFIPKGDKLKRIFRVK